ncbi:MAG: preprotein translocase subunit YajC [Halanaerobiales bacterium]
MESGFATILLWVIIFGVIWFFLIRPQRKQQKQHEEMLEKLEVGDEVVTIGGIKGKIISIKDNNVKLRIASNVDINLVKSSIGQLNNKKEKDEEQSDK